MSNPNFTPTISTDEVWRGTDSSVCLTDIIGAEDKNYPGCYYRTVNGVTEWINPPMVVGTEYRTTEQWNGKVVYTILVDCGAISNQKAVTVENISQTEIFKCEATVGGHVLPYKTYQAYVDVQRLGSNNFRFYFYCGGDIVGQNVRARVWYVKD